MVEGKAAAEAMHHHARMVVASVSGMAEVKLHPTLDATVINSPRGTT